MRVFVAGATGAIGGQLVPQLLAAGHEVTGMTRSEGKAQQMRDRGAEVVVCDVYDRPALMDAVTAARPEAVIHLLTAFPPKFSVRSRKTYAATNRIRREGTRILIAAARAAGVRRFVAESIAFLYDPEGGPVKDEAAPPFLNAPAPFGNAIEAVLDLEQQVLSAPDLQGLVLRYGYFYGAGTGFAADGASAREVRRLRYPIVGSGDGIFSFIHVHDAAAATVTALERSGLGIYNVTDDDPAAIREWLPVYAQILGAPPPPRVPIWLARLLAGPAAVSVTTEQRGASNAKGKRELGWQLRYPSWRQGFREGLE